MLKRQKERKSILSIYILENLDVCFHVCEMSKSRTCSPSPLPDVSKLSVEIGVHNEYLLQTLYTHYHLPAPTPHVFISTCFSSLKRFAYEYMIFSCLKSFKIANKGLIKNHSFQSQVASADSKSTWPGCTVKYYLLFFRLLCFYQINPDGFPHEKHFFGYFQLQVLQFHLSICIF